MKKSSLFFALVLSTPLYIPTVNANDNMGLRICEYVKADAKSRLRGYLKQQKIRVRDYFDTLTCNNQNVLIFAASNQSLSVGEFLISKIPSKKVAENVSELSKHSAHLAEVAQKRIK